MNEVRADAGRQWHAARWITAAALMAVVAIAAVSVHAQGRPGGPGMDGGPGHGEMFGGPPMMMGRGLDRMLDGLNASDAQRTQVREIAKAAAADLRSQRESGRALHDKAVQIFSAPTVDAAAAEGLRQQWLAQHDQASKRVLQAMLDIAKVLTPEQRAKIAQRMKEREAVMQDRMQRMQRERAAHAHPAASAAPK